MARTLALAALALALMAAPAGAQSSARRITVSFHATEMADVARAFAEFSGTSIVLGADATGLVTAEVRNQPWDVAFGAILAAHGLGMQPVAPGLLRVDELARLAATRAQAPLVTRVFRLSYVPATEMAATLAGVKSERGSIAVSESTNSLVVTDTEEVLARIAALLGHT